jgi:DNA-directed RNA polymerase subunit alpha
MNMDVRDLEFSVRCNNCMARRNIKKHSELTAMSKDDISKMRNIGKKSIDEMDGKLAEIGLWWKMTDRDWVSWGLSHIEWIKAH